MRLPHESHGSRCFRAGHVTDLVAPGHRLVTQIAADRTGLTCCSAASSTMRSASTDLHDDVRAKRPNWSSH